jgi:nucleotide-binding universal stress UspA family protein
MSGYRRICCPVDFSDPSRLALEEAAGLARLVVGSVAEAVVRTASCSVLVVRSPEGVPPAAG